MSRYPKILSDPISFNVTTVGVLKPFIPDIDYTLGTSPITISHDPFKIIPSNINFGPSKVDAYIYTGVTELPD